MTDSVTVTFRTGEDEEYFEALEDMARDGYFDGNLSKGIRKAISAYLGAEEFPREDFGIYFEARNIASGNEEAREEILDEKFFSRAVNEMVEKEDISGLKELGMLYEKERY